MASVKISGRSAGGLIITRAACSPTIAAQSNCNAINSNNELASSSARQKIEQWMNQRTQERCFFTGRTAEDAIRNKQVTAT
jgi:hypothetical protein